MRRESIDEQYSESIETGQQGGYDPVEVRTLIRESAATRAELESLWLKSARVSGERDELQEQVWRLQAENRLLESRNEMLLEQNEELREKVWASEKALSDSVGNLQALRDKLNMERAKHGQSHGKQFMGDLSEWSGEF